jgi:hypothetical protein
VVENREQGIVEKNGTEEKQTYQPLVFIAIMRHKKTLPMENRVDVLDILYWKHAFARNILMSPIVRVAIWALNYGGLFPMNMLECYIAVKDKNAAHFYLYAASPL